MAPGWLQWLAVALLSLCAAVILLVGQDPQVHNDRLPLVFVVCLPIAALRRWPLPVLAAATVVNALVMSGGNAPLPFGIVLGLASYLAASRLPRRVSIPAAATRPAWPRRPNRKEPSRSNAPASRSARSGCASPANCTTSWPTPSR